MPEKVSVAKDFSSRQDPFEDKIQSLLRQMLRRSGFQRASSSGIKGSQREFPTETSPIINNPQLRRSFPSLHWQRRLKRTTPNSRTENGRAKALLEDKSDEVRSEA